MSIALLAGGGKLARAADDFQPWTGTIKYHRSISLNSKDGCGSANYTLTISFAGDAYPNGPLSGKLSATYQVDLKSIIWPCVVTTTELVTAHNVDLQWPLFLQPAYTDHVGLVYQQPGDIAPRGTGLEVWSCPKGSPPPNSYTPPLPSIPLQDIVDKSRIDQNNVTGFKFSEHGDETNPAAGVTGGWDMSWAFSYVPDLVLTLEPDG